MNQRPGTAEDAAWVVVEAAASPKFPLVWSSLVG
jgi:hypothetical protein